MPSSEDEWKQIAEEFTKKWQFPHCVGALDGKHIAILPPPNTGSLYFNYKHFFSIVLLALVDANYRFLYVDIGSYGRVSDGGVFNDSTLSQALAVNSLHLPTPDLIEGAGELPYVLVADDAFAMKSNIMKPFGQRGLTAEQRIYNYRLSRARRVVENAFGILSQRFRIFTHAIPLAPEKVETVTMAACCLHNFLTRDKNSTTTYAGDYTADNTTLSNRPTSVMLPLHKQGSNRCSSDASVIRDKFCDYFNSNVGSVSWQVDKCS